MQRDPGSPARRLDRLGAKDVTAPLRRPLPQQTAFVAPRHLPLTGVAVAVGSDLENDEAGKGRLLCHVEAQSISRSHEIIGAGEAGGEAMFQSLAGAARVGHFGEAGPLSLVDGPHPRRGHPGSISSQKAEDIPTADIVGPLPGPVVAHPLHQHRTHIENGAATLSLIGFITNALTPGSHRALVPELVTAPTDEAELRVRGRGQAAPVTVADRQFQLEFGPGRERDHRKAVEPGPSVDPALGTLVPVLAELHRDAGGIARRIAQDRAHARDRRAEALAEARPGLFKEETGDLRGVGGIGKDQLHALDGVIVRIRTLRRRSFRHERDDPVEIDAVPAARGVVGHGTRLASGDLARAHDERAHLRRGKGRGIPGDRSLGPVAALGDFLLFERTTLLLEADLQLRVAPLPSRPLHRDDTVAPERFRQDGFRS